MFCNINPKVTVIMPVYNASKYLHDCMSSLLSQTLRDIEIICIDDGSTDDSFMILEEYASKDSRIHLFKQENKGAGAARNIGLSLARGRYLSFLDSDDFFYPEMLSQAYYSAEKYDSDVVLYRYNYYYDNQNYLSKSSHGLNDVYLPKVDVFSDVDVSGRRFRLADTNPWNKLFKHDFVRNKNLKFMEIMNCNDVYFVMSAMYLAKKISVINQALMAYRVNTTTSLQSTTYKSPLNIYHALLQIKTSFCQTDNWSLEEVGFVNFSLEHLIYQLNKLRDYGNDDSFNVLSSSLATDGFEKLGITQYGKKDFENTWVFNQYVLYFRQVNSLLQSRISSTIILLISYARLFARCSVYLGLFKSLRLFYDRLYDQYRSKSL